MILSVKVILKQLLSIRVAKIYPNLQFNYSISIRAVKSQFDPSFLIYYPGESIPYIMV
jgi:hypothetical protein